MRGRTQQQQPKEPRLWLEKFEHVAQAPQPDWLRELRQAGRARFMQVGLPTVHDEEWRLTNLADLERLPVHLAEPETVGSICEVLPGQTLFACLDADVMVFVNGQFVPRLSALRTRQSGLRIGSLAGALATEPELVKQSIGSVARIEDNGFAALNTAGFVDGALVHVPPGHVHQRPILVMFISAGRKRGATSLPRNLIVIGPNASATIIESYVGTDGNPCLTNAVTEITVGEGATLEHCKLQDEAADSFHIGTVWARLGRGCGISFHSIALGGRLSRNNIRVELDGPGVTCLLNGLYMTRAEQQADHHMVVEHRAPHCSSQEFFNGILADRSKAVFHGRIYVHPGAIKTDAKQTNKNLLLSDTATAHSKPQLEIYADDVKCTHGATVGKLSDESIFYLRSRGIGIETARRMLIRAFAGEIIERIKFDAVRTELDETLWKRLTESPALADTN